MAWQPPTTILLIESAPGSGASSEVQELNPGESAVITFLRTDSTPTENWLPQILPCTLNDPATVSDISGIRRIFGTIELRPIFPISALGRHFYLVKIENADGSPVDTVAATVTIQRDGVDLSGD